MQRKEEKQMNTENTEHRDPRDMTDDETMKWMQDLIACHTDDNKTAIHVCNFDAVKLPLRRKILHILEEKPLEVESLAKQVELDPMKVKYHLNILINGCFVEMKEDRYDLTPGGMAVVRSDNKRTKNIKESDNSPVN